MNLQFLLTPLFVIYMFFARASRGSCEKDPELFGECFDEKLKNDSLSITDTRYNMVSKSHTDRPESSEPCMTEYIEKNLQHHVEQQLGEICIAYSVLLCLEITYLLKPYWMTINILSSIPLVVLILFIFLFFLSLFK